VSERLPTGWASAKLSEVAALIGPGFPSGKHNQHGAGVPHIRPMNISANGTLVLDDLKYVEVSSFDRLLRDDVLFNNTNSPALLGKTTWIPRNTEWAYSNHMTRIRLVPGAIDPRWLAGFLHNQFQRGYYQAHCSHHVNQSSINRSFLATMEIPVPPAGEQLRILDKVDTLISDIDAAVKSLRGLQAKLKRYRQAVLKAAVEGELSREWREAHHGEIEPASELLKRILAERRRRWEEAELAKMRAKGIEPKDEKWKERYQEPSESSAGLPELPKGWCWASMEQLLVSLGNGTSRVPHGSGGIRILRISSVRANRVDMNDVRSVPNSEALRGYRLQFGELLFTRYNGNPAFVGLCGMVPADDRVTVFPDKLIRGRVAIPETASYLAWSSNVGESRSFIEKRIRTTAGQAGVSGSDLKAMPVALPPMAEQEMLTAHVNRLLDGAAILGSQVSDDLRRAARLRQSILEKAFRGELVPQDPTDEPASVLVERIRAERAAEAETSGKKIRKARLKQAPAGARER
jgi:type I restriction enzyme, S subunit